MDHGVNRLPRCLQNHGNNIPVKYSYLILITVSRGHGISMLNPVVFRVSLIIDLLPKEYP
jgi:hypothetical protein